MSPTEDDQDDTPTIEMHRPRRGQNWEPEAAPGPPDVEEESLVPPPSVGRRVSSAVMPDGPRTSPRRSATSALSPLEPETPESEALSIAFTPELAAPAPEPKASAPADEPVAQDVPLDSPRAPSRSGERDRFGVWFAAAGIFAAIALIAGMAWSAINPPAVVVPTAAPTSTTPPAMTAADLWQPEDLAAVVQGKNWYTAQTLSELSATSPQVACLTAVTGTLRPSASLQRTLTVANEAGIAALHQIDHFDSADDAANVYRQRVTKLAACDDQPAYIQSATAVTGIGDAATQVTIAYQGAPTEFHTVLLVRNGSAISMFDVAQPEAAVGAEAVTKAASTAIARSCSRFGTCPSTVAVAAAAPPTSPPAGWLIESDWPRVTPGTGRWTATEPGSVTAVGTGCENLSLATVQGPTARTQRTFLLGQDPKTPATFGADAILFTFQDAGAAGNFAKTLGDNIASCRDRLLTATVAPAVAVSGKAGDIGISGRSFVIEQTPSADSVVVFQVAVVQAGKHVTYVMVNTDKNFQLSKDQLTAVATRAGERATQTP